MTEGSALAALGWTAELAEAFESYAATRRGPHGVRSPSRGASGLAPGRVVAEHRAGYVVRGEDERLARARGRLYDDAEAGGLLPAVGDWVALGEATIEAVLPRRTSISRKAAWHGSDEQVLAANVDVVFIVTGLDGDFNARRLERYLTTAWNSGASPVVVLTKLDVSEDPELVVAAEAVAMGVPVLAVSGVTGQGLDALERHLAPGRTAVLLGSSGVGKSTLINRLLGEERLPTAGLRRDGRGRHTTRHRELFALPGGALVVDTPGIRELQLWEGDLDEAFADVADAAAHCRFRDCAHESEPGCAVRERIEPERLRAYRKLQRELRAIEARANRRLHRELKQRWKQRARESRRARRYY